MQGAAFVERYRSYAARCIAIARNVSEPAGKLVLLEMAQSWLNLAEQAIAEPDSAVVNENAATDALQRD